MASPLTLKRTAVDITVCLKQPKVGAALIHLLSRVKSKPLKYAAGNVPIGGVKGGIFYLRQYKIVVCTQIRTSLPL
ncbi:hypothetical protein N474_00005 [Pseudoalteromonas luteoviolacea CPMOR-2]|uniref:Uncharacterized protein n=1 Tax=Pseudoalteromonas luteoviolacea DSM 6061 TaxID=1365250 RepID=A0A166WS68_9GAMM|nr:hypothetical protein N475_03060 [Pseudoalteromonas luteoviolacea DSM 6061]KZN60596.1 hypothetical protein N474_00005 [Pseudoalteromonas luteoviolacea CPMOR-2]